MLHSVRLEDCLLRRPVTVKPEQNVMEAIDQILQHKISGVCVVDDDNNLVGVLSELDCLKAILGAVYNEGGVGPVRDYMTTSDLKLAGPNANIVDIAQDMLNDHLRRRPVVEDGKLVGQITCRQLLKAVRDFRR